MDLTTLVSVAEWAELRDVKVPTASNYVQKATDNDGLKPVKKFGSTYVYWASDLDNARLKYQRKEAAPKVLPEKHAEVVERAERLAVENAFLLAHARSLGFELKYDDDGGLYMDVAELNDDHIANAAAAFGVTIHTEV